ncbi:MAG: amidase family protein, partial [Acidobacteriota bacterium]
KTLDELIEWNKANAAESMPYFSQEILEQAAAKGDLDEQAYKDAREKALRTMRQDGIDKAIAEHELDAFVAPSNGPSWRIDLVNGDNFGGGSSTPAAVAGYPAITVPAGFVQGLPVGLSIFAGAFEEPKILRIAYAYEQATKHRRPPEFKPTLGFA